jgi:hypothetical protein
MVSRITFLTLLVVMLIHSASSFAQTELSVSVDKNKLYQNEILNVTVQANSELDFSLGGLMNFGGAQIESPSFEGIEQDWEIVDKQQSYNMQSINGNTQSIITWRYALSPKSEGVLQLPAAKFQDATSTPINIQVLAGNRPIDEANPPSVFLKASIDKPSPYLQEQVIYTLELYTLGEARGDMSEPSHPDLIIEALGDTTKTYKMRYNRRYEVYERRYLLFPQKSGALTISAQEFSGTVVDARTRRRGRARELSNDVTLNVKQPPAGFSGSTWLPATSLFINETYQPDVSEITQGESITRQIDITALGLLGSALPELATPSVDGLKIYPDQAQVNASEHSQGVQSSRRETQAMVAVSPGEYVLPAIDLKWWDTVNDIERIASVPARTIKVLPSATAKPSEQRSADNQISLLSGNEPQSGSDESVDNQSRSEEEAETSSGSSAENTTTTTSDSLASQWWMFATFVALVLWAWHASILYRRLNKRRIVSEEHNKSTGSTDNDSLETAAKEVLQAIETNASDLSLVMRRWLLQLERLNPHLSNELRAQLKPMMAQLEAHHYGANKREIDDGVKMQVKELVEQATSKVARNLESGRRQKKRSGLKPFYPA